MIMNTEEFKLTSQRLQTEQEEFVNNICNLIKQAETVEQKAQEQYYEGYQKGLDDAWELARKLLFTEANGGMSLDEITKCFGSEYGIARSLQMDVVDAKAKYDAWIAKEENKEQPDEIQVGDVVYWNTLYEKMIVIKKVDDRYGLIHLSDGSFDTSDGCYLLKTGEHYDLPWAKQCQ